MCDVGGSAAPAKDSPQRTVRVPSSRDGRHGAHASPAAAQAVGRSARTLHLSGSREAEPGRLRAPDHAQARQLLRGDPSRVRRGTRTESAWWRSAPRLANAALHSGWAEHDAVPATCGAGGSDAGVGQQLLRLSQRRRRLLPRPRRDAVRPWARIRTRRHNRLWHRLHARRSRRSAHLLHHQRQHDLVCQVRRRGRGFLPHRRRGLERRLPAEFWAAAVLVRPSGPLRKSNGTCSRGGPHQRPEEAIADPVYKAAVLARLRQLASHRHHPSAIRGSYRRIGRRRKV
mmetsp:Transcript_15842/g.60339  ORF Transcript_15842/g.60339 Transcript_15842/m.60339 type:complete len:286 (-) Transcript_15842:84-941(-)